MTCSHVLHLSIESGGGGGEIGHNWLAVETRHR